LRPKKSKDFIPVIAKNAQVSTELAEEVILEYWREVRKNLSGLSHNRIHIANLGDFIIKHWKINDKINILEGWEKNNKQRGLQQITSRFKTVENLFDLKNLNKIIEEESQRKDFIKLHKYESKKKHNPDMEEQGPDLGGDKE
jgi:nucleoid DNA-binding protein